MVKFICSDLLGFDSVVDGRQGGQMRKIFCANRSDSNQFAQMPNLKVTLVTYTRSPP